jgi:hypothetical protein
MRQSGMAKAFTRIKRFSFAAAERHVAAPFAAAKSKRAFGSQSANERAIELGGAVELPPVAVEAFGGSPETKLSPEQITLAEQFNQPVEHVGYNMPISQDARKAWLLAGGVGTTASLGAAAMASGFLFDEDTNRALGPQSTVPYWMGENMNEVTLWKPATTALQVGMTEATRLTHGLTERQAKKLEEGKRDLALFTPFLGFYLRSAYWDSYREAMEVNRVTNIASSLPGEGREKLQEALAAKGIDPFDAKAVKFINWFKRVNNYREFKEKQKVIPKQIRQLDDYVDKPLGGKFEALRQRLRREREKQEKLEGKRLK